MSVIANDLISSVGKALQSSNCEADWRGVCARAYYAIYEDGLLFHDALPMPGSLLPNSTGGRHENLIERLKNPTIPKADPDYVRSRRVGYLMATLHAARVKSDYKRRIDVDRALADNCLAEARMVFDELHGSAAPPTAVATNTPSVGAASSVGSGGKPSLTRIK